jgi:flavin reductase (DIM6/NTAB) family NADH-FMN oxidoreductase RutF
MKKSLGKQTILYPTPVLVVGTYDNNGQPNFMLAAWGGICCSEPPCLAVSIRKIRYTYDAIIARKAFTVSLPSAKYVKEADYFGMASGRADDKVAKTGLTAVKSEITDAPFIKEFPLIIECQLLQAVELGSHVQFIGEIKDVKADEGILGSEGMPDITKCDPLAFIPGQMTYNKIGEIVAEAFNVGKSLK